MRDILRAMIHFGRTHRDQNLPARGDGERTVFAYLGIKE